MTERTNASPLQRRVLEWYNEKVGEHDKARKDIQDIESKVSAPVLEQDAHFNFKLGQQHARTQLIQELGALLIAGSADEQGQLEPQFFTDTEA